MCTYTEIEKVAQKLPFTYDCRKFPHTFFSIKSTSLELNAYKVTWQEIGFLPRVWSTHQGESHRA